MRGLCTKCLEGEFCELRRDGVLRSSLWVMLLLDHRLCWLRSGYGVCVPMHYLPGAFFRSKDARDAQSNRSFKEVTTATHADEAYLTVLDCWRRKGYNNYVRFS
jgi:hypothetical protein